MKAQAEISESPLRPELGQSKFSRHCLHEATNILQLALRRWKLKARNAQASPTSKLVFFLLLARMVIPRAGHLWPVSLNRNCQQVFVVSCFMVSILTMIDKAQLQTELEIQDLLH